MQVSQKSVYALRAVLELAKHYGAGPVKTAQIAGRQAIPQRFLEVILSELKRGGFVRSRRGNEGGYELARSPEDLTVGEIMVFVQGPIGPIACLTDDSEARRCCLRAQPHCIFRGMWKKIHDAISSVYEGTTFDDLVQQEQKLLQSCAAS
ncbi:hypothetical protein LCGC14_1925360 [marine sediment metagenome]|uniref:Rrf2 family transcriptional regulator n=1 Tax=marine sediment metagenome TaxID=412755 RepID=A0A0F9I3F0_9ZZZZ